MKDIFVRSKFNPIIKPNPKHEWESLKVYNPGAIFHNGKYHLFYRAMGIGKNWRSVLGYAVSEDGEHFKRFSHPIIDKDPSNPFEVRGLEDPRITKIDDTFFMAYAAYDGKIPKLHISTSSDLKKWKKGDALFKDFKFTRDNWSKSGAIFPEKINGKYWMLFNEPCIWLANSNNGIKWEIFLDKPFLEPRKNTSLFDNVFVEIGPPPIKTKRGWLVFYHGVNNATQYNLGFLLLDLNNPTKILYRSNEPVFSPKEYYEISGIVDIIPGVIKLLEENKEEEIKKLIKEAELKGFMPQVIFATGIILKDNTIRLYYGASDQFICTATAFLEDILSLIPKNV